MKKLLLLSVSILMVTLTACSGSDSNDDTPTTFIKFKVDGVAYNYEVETLTSLKKLITGRVGEGASYREVSLWMPVEPTVGAHTIVDDPSSADDTYTAIYAPNFDNRYDATSGTVTITSIDDNYIKGTFSYTVDTGGTPIVISEGEFIADK
ncbi:hypothetical protein [Flavobacterium sp.]|uniref:hypothetical protein n=1 Tax=Flavobacterium sp. TaxID=239 RepID=UPI002633C716|nr:hypothetical protein [Flavobacterium sp.]